MQQLRQPRMRRLADRLVDELRLAAFAMGRHHGSARHRIDGRRAKVLPNDVEAEVDAGGAPGGGCRRPMIWRVNASETCALLANSSAKCSLASRTNTESRIATMVAERGSSV